MVRAVVQRVTEASVTVAEEVVGAIGPGLVLLVGVEERDQEQDAATLAAKVAGMRIFPDDQGRMNVSLVDAGGAALVISQFTLLASVRRGRRPSFTAAAAPEIAEALVAAVAQHLRQEGIEVATGSFGAMIVRPACEPRAGNDRGRDARRSRRVIRILRGRRGPPRRT